MYSFELIYLMYLMDMMMIMMIPPLMAIVRWCAYNTYNLKMNQLWQQFEDVVARSLLFSVWDVVALLRLLENPTTPGQSLSTNHLPETSQIERMWHFQQMHCAKTTPANGLALIFQRKKYNRTNLHYNYANQDMQIIFTFFIKRSSVSEREI